MNSSFTFILTVSFFLLIQNPQNISAEPLEQSSKGPATSPALYVFGDSLVDSGNNNFLSTRAKVKFLPYGIDFPNGATGRFTNGKTTVDFFEKSKTTTGINYASGASGILPETGTTIGDTLCLEEQVNYFERTVKTDLPKSLKTQEEVSKQLLSPYLCSKLVAMTTSLITLTKNIILIRLYNLGARKFVVFELGPIGCAPGVVGSATTPCNEKLNNLVNIFNMGLPNMTQELTSAYKGSNYVHGLVFKRSYEQNQSPAKYDIAAEPGNQPCQGSNVAPTLYVFGDSLVDSGNNNFLNTPAKAKYMPYGVDFPNGATGRFTNGKTTVDFFAEWLGLPYVAPYLGLSEEEKSKNKSITFEKIVKTDLPKSLRTPEEIAKHLSKSVFVIQMGSNDYIINYLQPTSNTSKTYNPPQFGARKFVVELGPIGCAPGIVGRVTPKPTTPCIEMINNLVNIFNLGLPMMTQELTSTYKGSNFIHGLVFKRSYVWNLSPIKYVSTPCCPSAGNGTGPCIMNGTPCKNKNAHMYWDSGHLVASDCFNGSWTCLPINVRQLVSYLIRRHITTLFQFASYCNGRVFLRNYMNHQCLDFLYAR
ncbi:hypothetical protein MKW94_004170 [Papaver nudicaule]|uniref:Uncharacterized protein n=1 Tax=Papaver nudicaule TaxID=74823 RepID=A0AA41S7I2_PAPNU|nr:hypothetical protein [Papaver nudicaule]